jgi:hypothetical protein
MTIRLDEHLKNCPFCGGNNTEIRENGNGFMRTEVISASILHWCEKVTGEPSTFIEIKGRNRQSAISIWNSRECDKNRCTAYFDIKYPTEDENDNQA